MQIFSRISKPRGGGRGRRWVRHIAHHNHNPGTGRRRAPGMPGAGAQLARAPFSFPASPQRLLLLRSATNKYQVPRAAICHLPWCLEESSGHSPGQLAVVRVAGHHPVYV
jgi:hypothetical protein